MRSLQDIHTRVFDSRHTAFIAYSDPIGPCRLTTYLRSLPSSSGCTDIEQIEETLTRAQGKYPILLTHYSLVLDRDIPARAAHQYLVHEASRIKFHISLRLFVVSRDVILDLANFMLKLGERSHVTHEVSQGTEHFFPLSADHRLHTATFGRDPIRHRR